MLILIQTGGLNNAGTKALTPLPHLTGRSCQTDMNALIDSLSGAVAAQFAAAKAAGDVSHTLFWAMINQLAFLHLRFEINPVGRF